MSRVRLSLLLGVVWVTLACVSETRYSGPLSWVDNISYGNQGSPNRPAAEARAGPEASVGAEPSAAPAPPRDPEKTVTLSKQNLADLQAFINGPQCIIADRIQIDASQIPFKAALVPVADPTFVESTPTKGPSGDPNGLIIRSRVERPMVERDWPRLRVGDGIDLMASKEIRIRYHSKVDKTRPVFLRVVAVGKAVYRDEKAGSRLEGDAVTLTAELVADGNGYILRHAVR